VDALPFLLRLSLLIAVLVGSHLAFAGNGFHPPVGPHREFFDSLMNQPLSEDSKHFLQIGCNQEMPASSCEKTLLRVSRYLVQWTLKRHLLEVQAQSGTTAAFYRLLELFRKIETAREPQIKIKAYHHAVEHLPQLTSLPSIDAETSLLSRWLTGQGISHLPYAQFSTPPACVISFNPSALQSRIDLLTPPDGSNNSKALIDLIQSLKTRIAALSSRFDLTAPASRMEDAILVMLLTPSGSRITRALFSKLAEEELIFRPPNLGEWTQLMIEPRNGRPAFAVTLFSNQLAEEFRKPFPHQTMLLDPLSPLGSFVSTFLHETVHATDREGREDARAFLKLQQEKYDLKDQKFALEQKRDEALAQLRELDLADPKAHSLRLELTQLNRRLTALPQKIELAEAAFQRVYQPATLRMERRAYRAAETFRTELSQQAKPCYPALLRYLTANELYNDEIATDEIIIESYHLNRNYLSPNSNY